MTSAVFGLFGVGALAHWLVTNPGYETSPIQGEWPYVLAFSGLIFAIAIVVPLFAVQTKRTGELRAALIVSGGAALSGVANVVEDSFKVEEAFYAFVLGSLVILVGLVALTALLARWEPRRRALVPAGTAAALLFYVAAGGPLMLMTWLGAAVLSLHSHRVATAGA